MRIGERYLLFWLSIHFSPVVRLVANTFLVLRHHVLLQSVASMRLFLPWSSVRSPITVSGVDNHRHLVCFSDVSVHPAAHVLDTSNHFLGCSGRWSRFHSDDIVDILRHVAKDSTTVQTRQICGVTVRSSLFPRRWNRSDQSRRTFHVGLTSLFDDWVKKSVLFFGSVCWTF